MTNTITKYEILESSVQLFESQLWKLEAGYAEFQQETIETYNTLEEAQAAFDKYYSVAELSYDGQAITGAKLYQAKEYCLIKAEYELIDGEQEYIDSEYIAESDNNWAQILDRED